MGAITMSTKNMLSNQERPEFSIVIPVFNEEESLVELHQEILKSCVHLHLSYEIIYIDDGSTDKSFNVLKKLYQENSHVKVLQFRKNFGKSEALSAGFSIAKGEMVITMDSDLQDDPSEIPKLLDKLKEGYDLVSGWKKKRKDPLSKRLPSKLFNRITSIMAGVHIHDFNCGLKIYRREVIESLDVYGELHRYLPAIAHRNGFSVTELVVKHRSRKYGKTKFGMARFSRGAFDFLTIFFLTRYKTRPLHLFGSLGFFAFLAGFIISAMLGYQKIILDRDLSNRPLLFLGILLIIVGIQFISIGLLGEMVTATQHHHKHYLIKKYLN